jgi:hypothetical protein
MRRQSDFHAVIRRYRQQLLKLGTDAAVWNEDVVRALAAVFTRRTGMVMFGMILLAIALGGCAAGAFVLPPHF